MNLKNLIEPLAFLLGIGFIWAGATVGAVMLHEPAIFVAPVFGTLFIAVLWGTRD